MSVIPPVIVNISHTTMHTVERKSEQYYHTVELMLIQKPSPRITLWTSLCI